MILRLNTVPFIITRVQSYYFFFFTSRLLVFLLQCNNMYSMFAMPVGSLKINEAEKYLGQITMRPKQNCAESL